MPTELRDLLGAGKESIRWERPVLFFGALLAQDMIWLIVYPLFNAIVRWLFWASSGRYQSETWFLLPPAYWVRDIVVDIVLAVLLLITFRLVRFALIAIPIVAIVYAPLFVLSQMAIEATQKFPEHVSIPSFTIRSIYWFAYICCFLGMLALAVHFIKLAWLALPVGSVAGTLLPQILERVWTLRFLQDVQLLLWSVIGALVFAAVFWLGLWLTAGREKQSTLPVSSNRA